MSQRPVAIGLFLCEQVIVEERTHNLTLVNCFHRWGVEAFPSEPVPFVVFALLTDGNGEIRLRVVVQRLDVDEEIHEQETRYRASDPLQTMRFVLRYEGLLFPCCGQVRG